MVSGRRYHLFLDDKVHHAGNWIAARVGLCFEQFSSLALEQSHDLLRRDSSHLHWKEVPFLQLVARHAQSVEELVRAAARCEPIPKRHLRWELKREQTAGPQNPDETAQISLDGCAVRLMLQHQDGVHQIKMIVWEFRQRGIFNSLEVERRVVLRG